MTSPSHFGPLPSAAIRYSDVADIRDWTGVGVGNDDTTAIQAAIDQSKATSASQGRALACIEFPAGEFNIGSLLLDRGVSLRGEGSRATAFKGIAGTTTGHLRVAVAHDGYDYNADGGYPPIVSIEGIGLTGPSKADVGAAAGLLVRNAATNPIATAIILRDFGVRNVALDGLAADAVNGAFVGYLWMRDGWLYNNGRDGLAPNSCTDWRFDTVELGVNTRYGALLSGCTLMQFDKTYAYANGDKGIYNFNSSFNYAQGMIDRNLKGGYYHDAREASRVATITSTAFGLNSRLADDTYSDVIVGASTVRDLRLFDCVLDAPQDGADGASKHNIEFEHASNGADVHSRDNVFLAGTIASANVTNQTGRVH